MREGGIPPARPSSAKTGRGPGYPCKANRGTARHYVRAKHAYVCMRPCHHDHGHGYLDGAPRYCDPLQQGSGQTA